MRRISTGLLLAGISALAATPAAARCVMSGTTTTCDAVPPNPETTPVQNLNVDVLTGAIVSATAAPPFSSIAILEGGRLTTQSGSLIRDNSVAGGAVELGRQATASLSGTILSTEPGSRAVTLFGGNNLVVNQGALVESSGPATAGPRNTKAGIITSGDDTVIQVDGTVRNLSDQGVAITGSVRGAPSTALRYYRTTINIGATGIVETLGDSSEAIVAGGTGASSAGSTVNVAGIVRASGTGSRAIRYAGNLTLNVLEGGLVQAASAPAIDSAGSSTLDLTVAGTVRGPAPGQIAVALGELNDRVTLTTTGAVEGIISGGAGTDSFRLQADTGTSGVYDFQASPLTGFETFSKEGPGTWTLRGDGSVSAAGPWSVNGGTLIVDGNLGQSAFAVAAGTRLGGEGRIGSAAVSGTLAPGNGIGTLTVNGPVSFAAGSTYEVQANAAGASDLIAATGPAALSGGTVQVLAQNGSYAPTTAYTVLTAAGGVQGQFATVTSNLAFLTPTLSYTANNVILRLTRNDIDFAAAAATDNQRSTAQAIQALGFANPLFLAVLGQSQADARLSFDALSGELYASLPVYLTQHGRLVRNALLSEAGTEASGVSLWVRGIGSQGHADVEDGVARINGRQEAILGGIGFGGGGFNIGVAGGFTDSRYRAAARSSGADVDGLFLGAYAGFDAGVVAVRAGAGRTWHEVESSRTIGLAGIGSTAAEFDGRTDQLFAEVSRPFDLGSVRLTPFAGYAYVSTDLDDFTETGGAAALTVDSGTLKTHFLSAGLRLDAELQLSPAAKVVPSLSMAYRHAGGDRRGAAAMRFASGGPAFDIAGTRLPRGSFDLDAGLDARFGPVSVGIGYSGSIAGRWEDHGGWIKAGLSF